MGNCNLLPIDQPQTIFQQQKVPSIRNQLSTNHPSSQCPTENNQQNKQNIFYNGQSKIDKLSSHQSNHSSILFTPKFNSITKNHQFFFNWDTNSPNASKFKISAKNVQFISEIEQPHQLISDSPLPLFGTTQFTIKIKKYGNKSNCISIGLISQQNIKEECSCRSSESLAYMTYSNGKGCILKQGRNILLKTADQANIGVQEEGLVTFIIDMNEMQASIERKQQKSTGQVKSNKICFQQCFNDQPIYVFVCMSTNGDTIDLL